MSKRYQVFISSTFTDMHEERQAAVEAILKAGHMPAGMELFTSGSGTQMEVIKEWIEESDIYLLILGGRYGTLDKDSSFGYTELEFNYAKSLNKPLFSVVIAEAALDAKVKRDGIASVERQESAKYNAFRERVLSEICSFYSDGKDIKLAIHESLPKVVKKWKPIGWVRASIQADASQAAREVAALSDENRQLRKELAATTKQRVVPTFAGQDFATLLKLLVAEKLLVPADVRTSKLSATEVSLADLLFSNHAIFAGGVTDSGDKTEAFLFQAATHLVTFGLAQNGKVPTRAFYRRLELSKDGARFVAEYLQKTAKSAV